MHRSILRGLLTRLGVHGPHIHFEGAHQGTASKQVLRVDHLPGRTTSSQSGWVRRSLWGAAGAGVGAGPTSDSVNAVFLRTHVS